MDEPDEDPVSVLMQAALLLVLALVCGVLGAAACVGAVLAVVAR